MTYCCMNHQLTRVKLLLYNKALILYIWPLGLYGSNCIMPSVGEEVISLCIMVAASAVPSVGQKKSKAYAYVPSWVTRTAFRINWL